MSNPTSRSRLNVEDIAVPKWNLAEELSEAIGAAGADVLPQEPIDADRLRRAAEATRRERNLDRDQRAEQEQERPRTGLPRVLLYPPLDEDPPFGASPDNPMGEGSEETALPAIDPVDMRLGTEPLGTEPLGTEPLGSRPPGTERRDQSR